MHKSADSQTLPPSPTPSSPSLIGSWRGLSGESTIVTIQIQMARGVGFIFLYTCGGGWWVVTMRFEGFCFFFENKIFAVWGDSGQLVSGSLGQLRTHRFHLWPSNLPRNAFFSHTQIGTTIFWARLRKSNVYFNLLYFTQSIIFNLQEATPQM